MAADIALDFTRIDEVAGKLTKARETITPMIKTLLTDVNGLLDNGMVFKESSPAMRDAYAKFDTSLTAAIDGIQIFSDMFAKIRVQMHDMDVEMAKNLKKN
ncbi:hypothetical protein [Embleya scabrispora]|uniref:hypothetical protein n=1 Tax=Embleya scabrispora TaxID=159449 RepID=UPI000369EBD5|nr:hypothetical protein [Embleya scabrispora]MYS87617.1 hypothetical protein [Streptomyces sp. SID5474]